jgi:hypothetical protein
VIDVNGLDSGGIGRSIFCDPDGRVLCQAGPTAQFIPMEIDLEVVKNRRERGILGLGQPLKSFRDNQMYFDIYNKEKRHPYLDSLGVLEKPKKAV